MVPGVLIFSLRSLGLSVVGGQWSEFSCRLVLNRDGGVAVCVVDSTTRLSCKKCRFRKCLNSGMKINWVTGGNKGTKNVRA